MHSTRFGSFDVPDDSAFDFGPGLLGFPDSTRYVVVEIEDDNDYFWLQSVDATDVAFLAIRPWAFFPDYELDVPDQVQDEIELREVADSDIFVLVTTHHDGDQLTSITANLLGPVVVNHSTRKGRQLVLNSGDYGTREPLVAS